MKQHFLRRENLRILLGFLCFGLGYTFSFQSKQDLATLNEKNGCCECAKHSQLGRDKALHFINKLEKLSLCNPAKVNRLYRRSLRQIIQSIYKPGATTQD